MLILERMLQRIVLVVDAGRVLRFPHIFKAISQLQILLQLLYDPGSLFKFFPPLVRDVVFE